MILYKFYDYRGRTTHIDLDRLFAGKMLLIARTRTGRKKWKSTVETIMVHRDNLFTSREDALQSYSKIFEGNQEAKK